MHKPLTLMKNAISHSAQTLEVLNLNSDFMSDDED